METDKTTIQNGANAMRPCTQTITKEFDFLKQQRN